MQLYHGRQRHRLLHRTQHACRPAIEVSRRRLLRRMQWERSVSVSIYIVLELIHIPNTVLLSTVSSIRYDNRNAFITIHVMNHAITNAPIYMNAPVYMQINTIWHIIGQQWKYFTFDVKTKHCWCHPIVGTKKKHVGYDSGYL